MTCLSCGHQNQPGARLCSICGTALEDSRATCPSCGKEGAADDHFCGACGSSLVPTREPSDAIPQRDLGGLLAETWLVYRENLRPFVLIALVPQIPSVVSLMIPSMGSAVFGVMLALVGFFLYILVSGAVIYAVVQQQVGSAVGVGECFAQAWRKALSLVVAYILFALALLASGFQMLILIGVPLFFYLLVAWFFFSGGDNDRREGRRCRVREEQRAGERELVARLWHRGSFRPPNNWGIYCRRHRGVCRLSLQRAGREMSYSSSSPCW